MSSERVTGCYQSKQKKDQLQAFFIRAYRTHSICMVQHDDMLIVNVLTLHLPQIPAHLSAEIDA